MFRSLILLQFKVEVSSLYNYIKDVVVNRDSFSEGADKGALSSVSHQPQPQSGTGGDSLTTGLESPSPPGVKLMWFEDLIG